MNINFCLCCEIHVIDCHKCVRRSFICAVERFLDSGDEVMPVLTHIRAIYEKKIMGPDFTLSSVSIGGTLSDAISEVYKMYS